MNSRTFLYRVCYLLFGLLYLTTMQGQNKPPQLEVLSLPSSSKAHGLGGMTASIIANEPLLALDNPALFGKEHDRQFSLSYMNYWQSTHFMTAFYSQSWGRYKAWGVGARYFGYGSLEGRDFSGRSQGQFAAGDLVLEAAMSYELSTYMRAGVSLKGIYSHIAEYQAYGLGVDLGLNYYNEELDRSIGIVFANLGGILKSYSSKSAPLPYDLRVGYSERLAHIPFVVHLTAYDLLGQSSSSLLEQSRWARVLRHFAFGLEYAPSRAFYLSTGFSPRVHQEARALGQAGLSGFSLGLGFLSRSLRFALSGMSHGRQMYSLMATFSYDFGYKSRL